MNIEKSVHITAEFNSSKLNCEGNSGNAMLGSVSSRENPPEDRGRTETLTAGE